MIIAIDGYEANVTKRVGIGRYAYEIIKHVFDDFKAQRSSRSDRDKAQNITSFRIYLPSKPLSDMPKETEWWQYRVVHPAQLWTFVGLPFALLTDTLKADAVFSPTHYIPRWISIPRIMAIMDVSYLEFPQMFRAKDLHQLVHWTAYSVRHAAKILTISEFSKDAIMKSYGVPKGRVAVTYPGLTKMTNDKFQMTNVLDKYKIDKPYLLSVGTLQPRKNYCRLIEAFALLIKTVLQKGQSLDNLQLVVVGKKGWLYEEILKAPGEFGIQDRVKFLEFVPDEDLASLYQNALCFALPSLYEGFGLPVLEAMVNKCPVIVSNVSSLPEIAGKAGIYVDPKDVGSIKDGLVKALNETKEDRRRRVETGLQQAKKFSWEKAAKETLVILEEVGRGVS